MEKRKNTRKGTKTSVRSIVARQKETEAVNLRLQGFRFREIAARLGYRSVGSVSKAIELGLSRSGKDDANKLREIQNARLDALLQTHLPVALSNPLLHDEMKDRIAIASSCGTVLKALQRRARLNGLDAPVQVEASGPRGQPIQIDLAQASDSDLQRIIDQLGGVTQV